MYIWWDEKQLMSVRYCGKQPPKWTPSHDPYSLIGV